MVIHKAYKNEENEWVYPADITQDDSGNLIDNFGSRVFECPAEKMSKSKKNTVSPESIVDSHGVDAVRLFIVSDTPPEKDFEWNTDALDGALRFLRRVWKTFSEALTRKEQSGAVTLVKPMHRCIKQVSEKYESNSLNKAVALIREFFNALESKITTEDGASLLRSFETIIKILYPIAPFICHEMWEALGHTTEISDESWPQYDEGLASLDTVTVAIQVNGRVRDTFNVEKDAEDDTLTEMAFDTLGNRCDRSAVQKVVVVKNRVVNIVLR
jgi:leucyl-tRNA synthetase